MVDYPLDNQLDMQVQPIHALIITNSKVTQSFSKYHFIYKYIVLNGYMQIYC
jgi:hypothetical protein